VFENHNNSETLCKLLHNSTEIYIVMAHPQNDMSVL